MDIWVHVRENALGRPYVCAEWRNGILPMRADVMGRKSLKQLYRVAEQLDVPVRMTDEAARFLETLADVEVDA